MNAAPPARTEYAVSMLAANLYGLAIGLPLLAACAWAYTARWGGSLLARALEWSFPRPLALLGLFLGGTLAHEWLHGLSWVLFGRLRLSDLHFGVEWKTLTPYAHVKTPLRVNVYRLGTLMPGLVLGLLPYLYGLWSGDAGWMLWGAVFTFAASGDLLVLWLLRRVPPASRVEDHPTKAGCWVIPGG